MMWFPRFASFGMVSCLLLCGGRAHAQNLLTNGSFETWHPVSGEAWGSEEPDGWHGWEISPWDPEDLGNPNHLTIQMDRQTGIPTPEVIDGDHRVGMDEGWRSCYGGIYQEVTGLPTGTYLLSGHVAWLMNIAYPDLHRVEVIAVDGAHTTGQPPAGAVAFERDGSTSNLNWERFETTVQCTTGTLTIYANLRSDDWDGTSFVHFDNFVLEGEAPVGFTNFHAGRVPNGDAYDITIEYDTSIPTTTRVDWGPTAGYGSATAFDPAPVTHHLVQLSGIAPAESPYHYRAHATADEGIDAYSVDQTFDAPLITFGNINAVTDPGSATVATISWTTNFETTDNRVFYRLAGTGTFMNAAEVSDPQPGTTHGVAVGGLALDTEYEYYVHSGGDTIIAAESSIRTFRTPATTGPGFRLGIAMVGGSIPDGGDDVGPGNEVQDMVERDWAMINVSGMPSITWATAQPEDPGNAPDEYDFSELDARAEEIIPGKALLSYYQMWGTSPGWVEQDTPRFWEKFEAFVTAMTAYVNAHHGVIYYVFENEPNISRAPDGWNWADWYVHCLEHFHAAVHRANDQTGFDNKVIAGNLSGHAAGGFRDLYARGLKDCSDLLGYHPYPYDIRDGLDVEDLAEIHSIQVQYGDGDKKIWVSEGWGSGRSAGFDRSSPLIEPGAQEVENMFLAMVNGWDNVMTPRQNWHPDYLWGMKFFCGNDNWGAMNWRSRATARKDSHGNITGFIVDGYHMTPDIAPYYWNGGMLDFYGNSKDCLIHVFPGNGLVFMNPGFELVSEPPNLHLPHFWSPYDASAPADQYGLDDIICHGGSRSLRLTRDQSGRIGVSQLTVKRSVIPGITYRARVWCRTQTDGAPGARFYVRFADLDGAFVAEPVWSQDLIGASDGWRQLEIITPAPAGARRVELGCEIDGSGTAWFDDVTISMASQTESGIVQGYTLDEGQVAVPNCIVKTTTGGQQTVSDANGFFTMMDVPTGTYDFVCRKPGYVPHRVRNQTVTAGKQTFVNFGMGLPTSGLTVDAVQADADNVAAGQPFNVTVNVANNKPYANDVGEVSLYIEQSGEEATERFTVLPSPSNPKVIPASQTAMFDFSVTLNDEADGETFDINAYAFGQEDRPNMLVNGAFDNSPWDAHWSFNYGADVMNWAMDDTDAYSPPRSLKAYVQDDGDYTWNWANNHSAYGPSAMPASPGRNFTVGCHHKDTLTGGAVPLLFIQEFYYDGSDWFYNGRRFVGLPHRDVWAHDVMIYETGSPDVNPDLYPTNRLVISVGAGTTNLPGSGDLWFDDVYVKETGDWLADDRADTPATITAAWSYHPADFDRDNDVDEVDFDVFAACISGPAIPQTDPGCADADFDDDEDVDQGDFGVFQRCLSGEGTEPDIACMN